jgi:transketolase
LRKNNMQLKPVPISTKIGDKDIELNMTRNGYGDALVELGETKPEAVVLTADLSDSTKASGFQKKYPQRFFELGVAEQNLMGVAAGMALEGKISFVSSYATFSPGRSWDQLRVSVAYSKANVKIAGAHTGVSVGPDGATHQALEDIAITRVLPDLVVLAPCDYLETKKAVLAAADYVGPVYFRMTREKSPSFTLPETPFKIGKAEVFRDGSDVAVVACGPLLYNALLAAQDLEKEGISVMVINNHTIKPIDIETIVAAAQKCRAIVTVEEHQVSAGMGSAVCEVLAKNFPTPVEMVGMQDTFGESGTSEQLIEKYGMGKNSIINAIKKVIGRKEK